MPAAGGWRHTTQIACVMREGLTGVRTSLASRLTVHLLPLRT